LLDDTAPQIGINTPAIGSIRGFTNRGIVNSFTTGKPREGASS